MMMQETEHESVNYTDIVKGLYNDANRKPVNKIQNALFVDKSVANVLNSIRTGEDAISFFAKYGNTTPIKFINCVQKIDPDRFRPYDLKVVFKSENQK
jgi:dynein heavy chain